MTIGVAILGTALVALAGGAGGVEGSSRAKPDLAVARLAVPPGAAAALEVRDSVRVSGRAGPSVVGYYLSRDRRRSGDDRRLSGGRTVTARSKSGVARLGVPAAVPRASYFVVACADDTRRVRERNERNNCRASASRVTLLEPFRPNPLNVTETLDTARAVSAEIGSAGGTLTATAADGARLTLEVPAGALPVPLQIRMTPLSGAAGLPAGGRVVAAARFEPEGLQLAKAATLTIVPAAPVPLASQLPFATEGGRDFHAYPILPDRAAIRLPLLHFSTFGISFVQQTEEVARRTPSSRAAWAEQTLAKALLEARRSGGATSYESAAYVALYVIGNEAVRPLLQQALTDRSVRKEAIRTYLSWLRQSQLLGVAGTGRFKELEALLDDLYTKVFRQEVEDVVSACERGQTGPAAALQIIGIVRQTVIAGVMSEGEAEVALRRMANCLRFELTMTTTTTYRHIGLEDFLSVRARAVVSFRVDPFRPNLSPLSAPLEVLGTDAWTAFSGCSLSLTAAPAQPFILTGLQMEIYLADKPVDPVIELTFDPGRLSERAAMQCSGGGGSDDFPVYRPVLDHFHAPTAYRVTDWTRVSGSAWAFERRFGPRAERLPTSGDWYEEETRFFLRHAPAAG